jgi:hypothetical protein
MYVRQSVRQMPERIENALRKIKLLDQFQQGNTFIHYGLLASAVSENRDG